jgi:leader peptidase (prepilin peptidase)/N-methyltransferase
MSYRKNHKLKLMINRSFCDHCGRTLKYIDPVPVINFIILGGKCRYCGTKIAVKYLWAEVFSGFIMLMAMFSPIHLVLMIPLITGAIFLAAWITMKIPDKRRVFHEN